jgi:pimeloyl-ACP methyl ester carboxylesterase
MTVTLPTLSWGNPQATHHALMIHGLGSSAATCWQVMEALAEEGYHAVAVDLRGHGQAPRTSTYRIADFASDVALVTPHREGPWDVVIGHSIGAASAVVAASQHPKWTRRLVLIDPALDLDDQTRNEVLENQRLGHLVHGVEKVRDLNPHWHPLDVQLKVQANQQASLWALEAAVRDNAPWNVMEHAHSLTLPTHVIGGEEERGSMFYGHEAAAMMAAHTTWSYDLIAGAGHSVHRDKPAETIASLRGFLATS